MGRPRADRLLDEALAKSRARFVGALHAGKPEQAAAVYARDAKLLAPSAQVIEGRQAIEAFWRAGLDAGINEVELQPIQVDIQDGAAYEIGRYSLRLASSERGTVLDRGNYLIVHWQQPDGAWQWAIETFNPDSPPAWIA